MSRPIRRHSMSRRATASHSKQADDLCASELRLSLFIVGIIDTVRVISAGSASAVRGDKDNRFARVAWEEATLRRLLHTCSNDLGKNLFTFWGFFEFLTGTKIHQNTTKLEFFFQMIRNSILE